MPHTVAPTPRRPTHRRTQVRHTPNKSPAASASTTTSTATASPCRPDVGASVVHAELMPLLLLVLSETLARSDHTNLAVVRHLQPHGREAAAPCSQQPHAGCSTKGQSWRQTPPCFGRRGIAFAAAPFNLPHSAARGTLQHVLHAGACPALSP